LPNPLIKYSFYFKSFQNDVLLNYYIEKYVWLQLSYLQLSMLLTSLTDKYIPHSTIFSSF
jgi:hypothetical protein